MFADRMLADPASCPWLMHTLMFPVDSCGVVHTIVISKAYSEHADQRACSSSNLQAASLKGLLLSSNNIGDPAVLDSLVNLPYRIQDFKKLVNGTIFSNKISYWNLVNRPFKKYLLRSDRAPSISSDPLLPSVLRSLRYLLRLQVGLQWVRHETKWPMRFR